MDRVNNPIRGQADKWSQSRGLGAVPSYLGQVATRSMVPNNIATGFKSGNGQTFHIARDDISSMQVAYANWYTNNTVHEAGSGGTLQILASIQYPIAANPDVGTWQSFKWSGVANTGVMADGATSALSDALALTTPIPRGACFLLRWHAEASVQIPFWQFTSSNSAALNQVGEGNATSNFYTDKTTGGTISAGTSANNLYPVLIVGQTSRPSCYLMGDSRCWGFNDTFDATGNLGEFARSLGEHYGYLNLGCPSETLQAWLTASTRRQALMPYFSHVIAQASINDISAGRTTAQLSADIASAAAIAKALGKKVIWATMCPSSTSTDSFVTVTNQTASAANAQRTGVNDKLRARQIAGIDHVFDVANVMESANNSGLWRVGYNGSAGIALTEGLHCNYEGYQHLKRSNVVDPRVIAL